MTTLQKSFLEVQCLDFDPDNPRFLDAVITAEGEARAIARMLEEENLEELVGSIGNQGFFPGEPLLVAPSPSVQGRYIVVEGNRRLAALRVLCGIIPAENLTPSLRELVNQAPNKPTRVDCFVFSQRREVLKYLGFRHISGPRRWEPLSKARYLADLIRNFYPNQDLESQLRLVAKDIGSKRDYVAQLLTTLNLYDHAKNKDFYRLQRVREEDISFSLLSTALSYTNITEFLKLPSRQVVNVDTVDDLHLKELLSWMFAQDQNGDTVLGESRRLKTLAAVLASDRATTELRQKGDLNQAYLFSDGPNEALNSVLASAQNAIASCVEMLNSEVEVEQGHELKSERILYAAEDLHSLVQRAVRRKRSRIQGEES
jgi:hypothetical protein